MRFRQAEDLAYTKSISLIGVKYHHAEAGQTEAKANRRSCSILAPGKRENNGTTA